MRCIVCGEESENGICSCKCNKFVTEYSRRFGFDYKEAYLG